MASRMDRYSNSEARSKKNEHLYKDIQDFNSYSNIAGVATIEKTNEVDITRVKEMLKNRENYQKGKKYRDLIEKQPKEELIEPVSFEQERSYDVMDALKQAKEDRTVKDERSRYRSLKHTQYDFLDKLEDNNQDDELRELIDTITLKKQQNDDLGLFDDLKSDTMVGDAKSIKSYIDEDLELEDDSDTDYNTTEEIDRTFFSSSLGFTKDDFEDLKDLQQSVKTSHKVLKMLVIIVTVIIAIILGYFIFNLIFK